MVEPVNRKTTWPQNNPMHQRILVPNIPTGLHRTVLRVQDLEWLLQQLALLNLTNT